MNVARDLLLTREWLEALILLAASLIGIAVLKRFLTWIPLKDPWSFMAELIPYILNLGYVVALSIFVQAAPLGARGSVWAENITYVLTVVVFLTLVRRALLLVTEWSTHRAGASKA